MEKQEYLYPTSGLGLVVQKAMVIITVTVPLIATLVAIVMLWNWWVSWPDIALLAAFYVTAGLGITAGYHRMLTHRSFEAPPIVRFIFLAMGSIAAEGGALSWASLHIQHHARSDREGDPHSPLEGFWHAHVGWLFNHFKPLPKIYGSWLLKDPMVVFFERTFLLWVALGLVIPFLIAGWTGLLWGGLVRIFLTHHGHLERKLRVSHLRLQIIRDQRSQHQSVGCRPAGLWRRMAQQPSRLPPLGISRTDLVAG